MNFCATRSVLLFLLQLRFPTSFQALVHGKAYSPEKPNAGQLPLFMRIVATYEIQGLFRVWIASQGCCGLKKISLTYAPRSPIPTRNMEISSNAASCIFYRDHARG